MKSAGDKGFVVWMEYQHRLQKLFVPVVITRVKKNNYLNIILLADIPGTTWEKGDPGTVYVDDTLWRDRKPGQVLECFEEPY